MFLHRGNLMYSQKPLVTPNMIDNYYRSYLKTYPIGEIVGVFWKAFGELELQRKRAVFLRITIQMHLLDVTVDEVDTDTTRLKAFAQAVKPHVTGLDKIRLEAISDSTTLLALSSSEVNTMITFWNENPAVFADV